MVNHIDTVVFASDSKLSPASSDHRFEVNGIFGIREIQDTVPIDEAITLDSSLFETTFQKIDDDTEIVDSGDSVDEGTLGQALDGLDEVVDDSEDEREGTGSIAAAESTCLRERGAKVAGILLESDGSNDQECQTGKEESNCDTVTCFQGSSRIIANSHGPGMDFVESQEPGDSTQADALGFVDHFLLDKDLNLSPADLPENSRRTKSPPFSGVKGRQSLAKRINRSSTKNGRIFDWDSDQNDENDPQNSPIARVNITNQRREDNRADDDPSVKKRSMDLWENRKVSTPPTPRSLQNSSAKHHKTEKASELNQGIRFISHIDAQLQNKEAKEQLEPEEEFFDIGVNTQIAAEAMRDLLYAHARCTNEEAREPGSSSFQENTRDTVKGTTKKYTEKLCSGGDKVRDHVTSAMNINHFDVSAGLTTRVGAKRNWSLTAGEMNIGDSSHASRNFTPSSCKDMIVTLKGRHQRPHNWTGPYKKRNSNKTRNFTKKEGTRTNVYATTSPLSLDEWKHPRAKRSRLIQSPQFSPNKPWSASSVSDRNEANTLASGFLRLSSRGNRETSSCQSGVDDRVDVANLEITPKKLYAGCHKIPCNKDLPRPFLPKELARLGRPGEVDDFILKGVRRRRNSAHVRVLLSQHLDDETIKQQKKIMLRLRISPASSSADSTHFIADRFARTRNMLEAIALGKPVVTPLWLESCGQARCLIDEKSYILRDNKKEKEIGFCMLTSLSRARQRPLLKGLKVCITPNINPDRGMIADLVKLSQGQIVEISEIISAADKSFSDDLLILSCEYDRDYCLPFINKGAVVYTSELLLNGIVIQKLDYARHRLLSIADKRNQRNKQFPATRQLLSAY